jgi:hypothetical protein
MSVRRLVILTAALLAVLLQARPLPAQDHATILETRSFPLHNRVRTVILEEDLGIRSYRIVRRGCRERQSIFDLFERLSR